MRETDAVRVAVVQAAPHIMDRSATLAKVADLAAEAASKGAKLVLFPEAFVPAYPRGLAFGTKMGRRADRGREDFARYARESVEVPGPQTEQLGALARKLGIYLSIGVVERAKAGTTLYCTLLYFNPKGELCGKHRKLKPTGAERLLWGEGDGSTLDVVGTPFGTLGGLICWENYMPLARTAMYQQGVDLYLAPTADGRESWQFTIRHIALEGRCFVLACNQFVTKSMYPKDLACADDLLEEPEVMCRGGSAIVDPNGAYVAGPLWDQEDILIADLDLTLIERSRFDFDVIGHYARPDVFELNVHRGSARD